MARILYLGDPHVKISNLKESDDLMGFVLKTALHGMVDRLEILGDLTDTDSIVRLEVLEFWGRWFRILANQPFQTTILVGNHDLTGSYSNDYSSLHPFLSLENKNFKIVHEPHIDGVFGYLPYIHDNAKFVEEANKLAKQGATVLVSHPNFEGAVYDNGSDIANGVRDSDIADTYFRLIGGHIHTEIEVGRIWYVGSPRWLNKGCANKKKGIYIVNFDDTGQMTSEEFISTESICTPIVALTWKEGEDKPVVPEKATVHIELVGGSDWVTKSKKELIGVSVSSKITDVKKSKERKSGKSLHEFLSNHYQAEPEKRVKLINYLEKLNLV